MKLQDNQVAEWSRHYIDYEELKNILKKVKQAIQRYEEAAKKKPELAQEIKSNYDKGIRTFVTGTPPISSASLTSLVKEASNDSLAQEADERTNLLTEAAKRVARSNSGALLDTSEGSKSPGAAVHGIFRSAASTVSNYFEKRFETSIRDTLAEIAALENEFDNKLLQEVDKVNNFYNSKMEEQEKRLSLLTENVVQSLREKYEAENHPLRKTHEEEAMEGDHGGMPVSATATVHRRGVSSLAWRDLVNRITGKNSTSTAASTESQAQTLLDVDELDGDDPDSLVRDKHEVKKIAVADSIQRALVDQYRTSQLLKNYAIMNYTGFVKIVKKHDKTLPHRKGKFKSLTVASNICNEGDRKSVV